MKILKKLRKRREKAKQDLYDRGYDYAIGVLARGEKTPLVLDAEQYGIDKNQFDLGMDNAIDYAIQHKLVKDNRV